jgi:hypothetical protein
MDQAELLAVISGMYDKLVTDVAERVLVKIDAVIGQRFSDARAELEATVAARTTLNLNDIEDCITTWAQDNLDVEGDVQRYVDNYFDINDHLDIGEKISEALDEIDWKEKINETLSGATIRLE